MQHDSSYNPLSLIGQTLSHFEITAKLGEGGMGEVYRADDTKLGREVAIKVLPADFSADRERLARFEREAKALASLNHQNIAGLHEVGEINGIHFLVMELVPGEDLAETLARGPIPLEETLAYASQIAEALEVAHERGIVHRDLKPANVKITPEGQVKLLDFGLASAWEEDQGSNVALSLSPTLTAQMTQAGVLLGTAAYMSPEQARGKRVDKRSDIWSFGVLLYEMLTGARGFEGETVTDLIAAIVTRDPDWGRLGPEVPPRLRTLIERCLERDPMERLRDVGEARIALQRIDPLEPREAAEDRPASPARRWLALLPWAVTAAVLIASIAVWPREDDETPASRPVRFTIQLPTDHAWMGAPTLSPGGESIVWAASEGRLSRIWVRRFDEHQAEPVRGTEGAFAPFFSPDGQWIGFFAGSQLMKVPVGGGIVSAIGEVSTMIDDDRADARWSRDGYIYYRGGYGEGIMRMKASGGSPEPVTLLDESEGVDTHVEPRLAVSGRFLLFTRSRHGVMAVDLTGKLPTRDWFPVLEGASGGEWAAPDQLLFNRDGAFWRVGLDVETMRVRGEPVALLDTSPTFTVAGGNLAYMIDEMDNHLVLLDREGRETLIDGPHYYEDMSLSMDGQRIAVTLWDERHVWILDRSRGTFSPLTGGDNTADSVWSPDQTALAVAAYGSIKIFEPSAGSPPREIYAGSRFFIPDAWLPDSSALAFTELGNQGSFDLWLIGMEADAQPQPLVQTAANESNARFSPDGRWLAWVSDTTGQQEVYVRPWPGPGSTQQVSTDGGRLAEWSPDGLELTYLEGDRLMAVELQPGDPLRLGRPRELFVFPFFDSFQRSYSPTPDGAEFVAIRRDEAAVSQIHITLDWATELEDPPGS